MTEATVLDQPRTPAGQWRLAEVQLANWGAFDGAIYRIPIARKGHLITGPSGSGKSSLLDAIATVLTPDKWLQFNSAAQGAGQRAGQRGIASYVRGAWSRTTDDEEDRVVSQYLRAGATWSGIVLRYENGVDAPVSLARLFFVRGTATTNADVSDVCVLDRSALDLRDLEPFARGGLETRKIQAQFSDAIVTSNRSHARFYARMRSIFDIASESALQLLHKTQSAKSLDSLDQLFRDYMLDRPRSFDLADTAVAQFGELRDAHDHVVQLRIQRDHLVELRAVSERFDQADASAAVSRVLSDATIPYQKRRSLELARAELQSVGEAVATLSVEADRAEAARQRAEEDFDVAQRRALELGGGDADQLQHRIRTAQEAARDTEGRWQALERQLRTAGTDHVPASASEFAELIAEIDRNLASVPSAQSTTISFEQNDRLSKASQTVRRIEQDVYALNTSGSTVPRRLLDVRKDLAEGTGLPLTALPFAAELIEVRPEFTAWTGAIERVLKPLALTMLVRTEHLRAVRRWADTHRVPTRLVFEEVTSSSPPPRPASSHRSVVNRITVADSPFAGWLTGIVSDRFDFACVDTVDELGDHIRAVTISGQQKTSRTRYEKDDSVRLDDRSNWVLGDRETKLESLLELFRDAQAEKAAARAVVERASNEQNASQRRQGVLAAIREYTWRDVDRDAAATVVDSLRHQLTELTRGDSDLTTALAAADTARRERDDLVSEAGDIRLTLRQKSATRDELVDVVEAFEAGFASGSFGEVDQPTYDELERRFRTVQRSITRQNIAEVGQDVLQKLHRERDGALATANDASNEVSRLAAEFKQLWSASAADLTPTFADRRAYLQILDEIVAHGLPDHEARFLGLLRDRSRDLIGDLVSELLGAPREIEERVMPVNDSLSRSRFDEGRFLRLRVKTRRGDTVARFITDLRSISEEGWQDDDTETAERRFATLAELMRKFASSEHIDRTWKAQCLDTRLHVTFLAEEIDEDARVRATYDSGVAMSGGQQQKLVVFCLAAALRYQLADPDAAHPKYGTIVFDEAFDKADTRYTRMALDVFVEFGFQLILATPQKLLQTIEPYVGAATSIENPTRQRSEVANVPWHESPS
ncbi:hypothetical protein B7R21_07560 [Subtercola boreus]|uniref:Uncharacterized protein n=1 Tax=Subtercola boreus TaxID=120213 RepID=A0A3E0VWQ4_9MICO|nr:ATP-binding protein [Subtercola boreus]RFA13909.1 hypothetical protein B7R21_07560 [Subtercola boreus]